MNFSDNLRIKRKQSGLSQEQFAEKMGVSRQAVSKWESGAGYPELDKLIEISNIFYCSLDDLLKSSMEENNDNLLETESDANMLKKYDEHYNAFSKAATTGVVLIILGVTGYMYLEVQNLEKIGEIALLSVIAISVMIFIYFGYQDSVFKKKYSHNQITYSENELDKFNKSFPIMVGIGVGIIILSIIINNFFEYSPYGDVLMLALIACGVGIFVYYGTQKSKYDGFSSKQVNIQKKEKDDKFATVIMLIATISFLVFGFVFNQWRYCWIFFPLGGILCAIAETLNK